MSSSASTPSSASGNTRPKVMFVDDEERIVRLLRMIFRDTYEVFTALSGAEAIALMNQHHFEVLVSDQRMPGMTGIELLSHARENSPETVRILLTGYSDMVAIIGAVNEGEVFRFLNKPWNQDEIKKVLAEAVEFSHELRARNATETVPAVASKEPPLAKAAMLLALDGVDSDRHEVMEIFMEDYSVIGASTVDEANDILGAYPNIGVVIADCSVAGKNTLDMLGRLTEARPSTTVVMLASEADSEQVVNLINVARIYRFAMKPIRPNVFRLAVAAAVKEHSRRLAEVSQRRAIPSEAAQASGNGMVNSIVSSLSRFTKVW